MSVASIARRASLRGLLRRANSWTWSASITALLLVTPLLVVMFGFSTPDSDLWPHLVDTVLADYAANTFGIAIGVACGTAILGVGTAWLVAMCEFPGRRIFSWALVLPLAFPGYVAAFVYGDLLEYAGPVQTGLRDWFDWGRDDYWFPAIRSLLGAVAVMSLVLYPYVYLLVQTAFATQSATLLETGRLLGGSPGNIFRSLAVPLARPALVAGCALAVMETLNDIGVAELFGIATFTTGIYRAWFGFGDIGAATRLATVLLLVVLAVLWVERHLRRSGRYHPENDRSRPVARYALRGRRALFATFGCSLPVVLGFALPAACLVWWHVRAGAPIDPAFVGIMFNTLGLALGATVLTVAIAGLVVFGLRLDPAVVRPFARTAGAGYAVPGVVVAVGVLGVCTFLDHSLDSATRLTFGSGTGLFLSGTVAVLLFAYAVRFLAVSINALESSYQRIPVSLDAAARTLGVFPRGMLFRVHVPLLRGGVATAAALVFVEVMKELPATLVLRPFDFNTLAVRAFEMADEERMGDAALPALAIVAVGLIPLIMLSRGFRQPSIMHRGRANDRLTAASGSVIAIRDLPVRSPSLRSAPPHEQTP